MLHDRAKPGMGRARGVSRIRGGGAVAQLHRLARDSRPLPRGCEVEQGDAHRFSSDSTPPPTLNPGLPFYPGQKLVASFGGLP